MSQSTYTATIRWSRNGDEDFSKGQYSRAHEWTFDGGAVCRPGQPAHRADALRIPRGSIPRRRSSPALVVPHAVLPRLRAAAGSCRLYVDEAEGVLGKDADGRMAMTRVTLRPRVMGATAPDEAALADLHHKAHDACFIANSVTTEVTIQQ